MTTEALSVGVCSVRRCRDNLLRYVRVLKAFEKAHQANEEAMERVVIRCLKMHERILDRGAKHEDCPIADVVGLRPDLKCLGGTPAVSNSAMALAAASAEMTEAFFRHQGHGGDLGCGHRHCGQGAAQSWRPQGHRISSDYTCGAGGGTGGEDWMLPDIDMGRSTS